MKNLTETASKLISFFNSLDTEVDIIDYISIDTIDEETTFEDIAEEVQYNGGLDFEVIYYYNAIEYLMKNDPSLKDSLEIANDLGYEVTNLNSEILASLLKTQNEQEKFYSLEDEINEFLTELFSN